MPPIYYINRKTKELLQEKVYGEFFVNLAYGHYFLSGLLGAFLRLWIKLPPLSYFYGFLQKTRWSKRKVAPFVKKYQIDLNEAQKNVSQFTSFNDFFVRKLKVEKRTINKDPFSAIMPADGRYLFIDDIDESTGFYVKGKKFSLKSFLKDDELSKRYTNGQMIIIRLCPVDYHRFHFPFDCIAEESKEINGYLHSVNLTSLKNNIDVFCENKRVITKLNSEKFNQVLFCEVGATCVGTIKQTYEKNKKVHKGDEKGYFEFGGSSIIMLFEKGSLKLASDLTNLKPHTEVLCKFGELLGYSN